MGAGAPRAEELFEQLRAERREREGEGQQLLQVLQQRERHRGLAQLAQEEDRVEQVRARHRLVLLPVRAAVGPLDAAPRLRHRLELGRAARYVAPQDAVHLLQAELDQRVERVRALEDVLARTGGVLVVAEAHGRAECADHLLQRRRLLRAQQLLPPRRDHRAGHRDGVGGRRRRRRRLLGVVEGVAANFLVLHFALHFALALLLLRHGCERTTTRLVRWTRGRRRCRVSLPTSGAALRLCSHATARHPSPYSISQLLPPTRNAR